MFKNEPRQLAVQLGETVMILDKTARRLTLQDLAGLNDTRPIPRVQISMSGYRNLATLRNLLSWAIGDDEPVNEEQAADATAPV